MWKRYEIEVNKAGQNYLQCIGMPCYLNTDTSLINSFALKLCASMVTTKQSKQLHRFCSVEVISLYIPLQTHQLSAIVFC